MNCRFLTIFLLALALPTFAFAQSSFSIDKIVVGERPPAQRHGIYDQPGTVFVPSVEAQLRTRVDMVSKDLIIKAYFFDPAKNLLGVQERPAASFVVNGARELPMADIFQRDRVTSVFFRIPDALKGKKWTVLVVFGNAQQAVTRAFPAVDPRDFRFPERTLVYGGFSAGETGKSAGPLIIEHVARTASKAQPQITMFFRMPPGVSDPRELKGLLCVISVAGAVEDVKKQLLALDSNPERAVMARLVAEHKLGILSWGARTLWSKEAGYEELTPEEQAEEDREFSLVADGWAAAVDEMSRKYGIPNRNMIISGDCQASQWANRLVMRKPERFLAAHLRLGGSFEAPRPEAARVIWQLSTGELDRGYNSNLDFYDACRALGYPITMKAEPGGGHFWTKQCAKVEGAFFKHVMEIKDRPPQVLAKATAGESPPPWPASFRNPLFWGDVLSQTVVPASEVDSIDEANRVPLPTEDMMKAWTWKEPEPVAATP